MKLEAGKRGGETKSNSPDNVVAQKEANIKSFERQKKDIKQLETYCKHSTKEFKFTNAYTESFNGDCKVQKRVSRGFKHKNNYLRKLCARNSSIYNNVNMINLL